MIILFHYHLSTSKRVIYPKNSIGEMLMEFHTWHVPWINIFRSKYRTVQSPYYECCMYVRITHELYLCKMTGIVEVAGLMVRWVPWQIELRLQGKVEVSKLIYRFNIYWIVVMVLQGRVMVDLIPVFMSWFNRRVRYHMIHACPM